METAPLKSFATWARTALIREVTARMTAVLAPGSSERVEQTNAVAALDKAVAAAGGADSGRAAVADKVAYTWFNRIIALRFMDANGYTGAGVVSPQAGIEVGQPEILAEAKRGVIDPDVVSARTRAAVAGLLDGTRVSGDPQGEAYGLLLADYCRHWNRAMPFMFEREGDFTELLIPANLLADDSVLNRSVNVLTEDVCKDVEVIGWLYQFYISERKDEVFAGFKKNKKAGADEIPAATQLFTPHWIVRYLVENSLGRLWMLNRPASGLVSQMDYYIAPVDEEIDFLKITKPEDLKVIDPACGSGHMLTYAFELLYAIYEEEGYGPAEIPGLILTHNLYGTEIDPRAGALAAFALTMKARAKQRTFFNKQVEPNICVIQPIWFVHEELNFLVTRGGDRHEEVEFWNQFEHAETVGSLICPDSDLAVRLARHREALDDDGDIFHAKTLERAARVVTQARYLAGRYSVVVANPPYMGSRNMSALMNDWAEDNFPLSKTDLYSMFIERASWFSVEHGYIGMITMHSWMFLTSFEKLRSMLLQRTHLSGMAHLGVGAFGTIGGAVVATTAFVLANGPSDRRGVFLRVTEPRSEAGKATIVMRAKAGLEEGQVFAVSTADLRRLPSSVVAYWIRPPHLKMLEKGRRLADVYEPKLGMYTGNDAQFLRYWFEVSFRDLAIGMKGLPAAQASGRRWFPCNKGGSPTRWYGNQLHVIDWENGGERLRAFPGAGIRNPQYFFRESVSWSNVAAGRPAFRYYPTGFVFSGKGPSIFTGSRAEAMDLLGYLNSSLALELVGILSASLGVEVGHISAIPVLEPSADARQGEVAQELVAIMQDEWNSREESWEFAGLPLPVGSEALDNVARAYVRKLEIRSRSLRELEIENDHLTAIKFGLDVGVQDHSGSYPEVSGAEANHRLVTDLISFAVGCMFGRYSLDEPGIILADQGASLREYFEKVPVPTFEPDGDNVIPLVEGDWFEDDIVERFRQFLRAALGEQHFEGNLRFVTESLGVKNLRDYFITRAGKSKFYDDHVQRYKKRPIYWLFSSPKGSFNALIYMHRYTSSTLSTVLNEYLREFQTKLRASVEHAERSNNAKEAERLRKILLELDEYEHDVLYPLASQNISIDLDDGVAVNYPKFGSALNKAGPR